MKLSFMGHIAAAVASLAAAMSLGNAAVASVETIPTVQTIPTWTTTYTANAALGRQAYKMTTVGSGSLSPASTTPGNTVINVVLVMVRVVATPAGGNSTFFDPMNLSPCDGMSAYQRVLNSPLFQATSFSSNGAYLSNAGPQQLISAMQRANFWSKTQTTNYGLTLKPTRLVELDYNVSDFGIAPISNPCPGVFNAPRVLIGQTGFDSWLRSKLAGLNLPPTSLALVITSDVAYASNDATGHEYEIGGYHGSLPIRFGGKPAKLVYGVASFESLVWSAHNGLTGQGARPDIAHIASVLEELVNNPFGDNVTPGYFAHYDRVNPDPTKFTCQTGLEVAQVGSMTSVQTVTLNGYVYHYADAAFHDYFFGGPSTGAGQKYSFLGAPSANTGVCPAH